MANKKNDSLAWCMQIKQGIGQYEQTTRALWYALQFTDCAIKLFKYKGLPKEIPVDIMERTLFNDGKVLFFLDKQLGYFALPTGAFAKYNDYGIPIEYKATSFNGKIWVLNNSNSVLIKNTPMITPSLPVVADYCEELANIRGAISVNVNAMKTPLIFAGEKGTLQTMKNTFKQISGNEPVLYLEEGYDKQLKQFNTQPTYIGDKLIEQFNNTMSQVLTFLGINNNPIEKAERLITDEANSNNDFIGANLRMRLRARQECFEKVNEMFGLNISVEVDKEALQDLVELGNAFKNDFMEGEDDGAGNN